MAILSHGSDLSLAPTLRPLVARLEPTVRGALGHVKRAGFTWVQLDAALSGIRPRELDQRARRDLLALLSRSDLRLAGLDLFLPREHFVKSDQLDRAMAATLASVELAADLGRVPLSVALPVASMSADVLSTIVEAADGRGVTVAVHAEDQLDALEAWTNQVDAKVVGCGLDPAALLARSQDPAAIAQRLGRHLKVARLGDMSASDVMRKSLGQGDLDIIPYRIAIDLAPSRVGPVVLDLGGVNNPLQAAIHAKAAWEKAAFTF